MNTKVLTTNIIFKDIIDSINKRNEILDEINSLQVKLGQKNRELQKLDDEVSEFKIDIKNYRLFFQTYNIILHDKDGNDAIIYDVKDIELKMDHHGFAEDTYYYEVNYDLSNLINKQIFAKNNKDTLKHFLHIFDNCTYSLKLKNKK
jgi:hypothetical protein